MHVPALLLASLFLAPSLQDIAWKLPERSAALYERSFEIKVIEPKDGGVSGWRPRFVREMNPPVLHQGELDEGQQYLDTPVHDLRNLAPHVAFNLAFATKKGGRHTLILLPNNSTRAVKVSLLYGPLDPEGRQEITGTLAFDPGQTGAYTLESAQAGISGNLRITRTVNPDEGRVQAFESVCMLDWEDHRKESQVSEAKVSIEESWTWKENLLLDSMDFRSMTARAVLMGKANLKENFLARWSREKEKHPSYFENLGLVLFALVHQGVDPKDPLVAEAFDRLRRMAHEGEEALAWAILALEAVYTPAGERGDRLAGALDAPAPRKPAKEDLALIERWCRRIEQLMDAGERGGRDFRWWMDRDSQDSYDNEKAIHAVMGLHAALRCGVEIKSSRWRDAARHWRAAQKETSEKAVVVRLKRPDRKGEVTVSGDSDTEDKVKSSPAGWSRVPYVEVRGEMTAMGLYALSICRAELFRKGKGLSTDLARIDRALAGGYAWFARHFTVRSNPGHPWNWNGGRYRYLFFLGRAMEEAGIETLQDRDWYFEGAVHLLEWQADHGGWGNDDENAFALLFLRR